VNEYGQRENQERGQEFQDEIRRGWRLIKNCWFMHIPDGKGATRPADQIILLQDINILAEQKRTAGDRFQLNFLRQDQLTGLASFERVLNRNYSLIFISFLNREQEIDEAYAFRFNIGLGHMKERGRRFIHLDEFRRRSFQCVKLIRIKDVEPGKDAWDLQEVVRCYKYL
jgi:hypothetical protein